MSLQGKRVVVVGGNCSGDALRNLKILPKLTFTLVKNGFTTGTTVLIDGGAHLV